jgi:hypothetical protein
MENDISLTGKPLYELKNAEITWNTPEDFKKVGKEKLEAIKKSVDEILELIIGREKLSNELFKEAEKMKTEITNFLLENKAVTSDGAKEKNGLRQKQIEISELQLKEKMSCWQDVAMLKKELRERQRELTDKTDRVEMLDKILEN